MENILQEIRQNNFIRFFCSFEFLLIFIYVVSVCIYIFGNFGIKVLMSMSDWIYYATFLALIWYAHETKKIREIEQTPVLDLYYRENKKCLAIRNSGKGTAYNVMIESIIVEDEENSREFEFYFGEPSLILRSDNVGSESISERAILILAKYKNPSRYFIGEQALVCFLSHITQQSFENKRKIIVDISYKNYLGKNFERSFYIYNRNHLDCDKLYKKEYEIELK